MQVCPVRCQLVRPRQGYITRVVQLQVWLGHALRTATPVRTILTASFLFHKLPFSYISRLFQGCTLWLCSADAAQPSLARGQAGTIAPQRKSIGSNSRHPLHLVSLGSDSSASFLISFFRSWSCVAAAGCSHVHSESADAPASCAHSLLLPG